VLRVEVSHNNFVAKFFLQIRGTFVATFDQGTGHGFLGFLSVIGGLEVDWEEVTVFGNGLEGFKKAECFQNRTTDC
jgi:hypothetical protein